MLRSFVSVENISYSLPDSAPLFQNITFTVKRGDKIALVGNNGVGKSTLAQILAGSLPPSSGAITTNAKLFYLPQTTLAISGSVKSLVDANGKIAALEAVDAGNTSEEHFRTIGDDWDIREQITKEFAFWGISHISVEDNLAAVSGGEKEKLLLAAAFLSGADIIIFDEPTNNLDSSSRALFIKRMLTTDAGALIISHDRNLLENIYSIMELEMGKLTSYGGNYTFYRAVKEEARQTLKQKESVLKNERRRLKSLAAKDAEKAAQSEKIGKSKIAKGRYPRIMAGQLKGRSLVTLAKKREASAVKIDKIEKEVEDVSAKLTNYPIKVLIAPNAFIRKNLVEMENIIFSYKEKVILKNFSLLICGGERLAIRGNNGSGKTTLTKLILGCLEPQAGTIKRNGYFTCLDQNLSIIDPRKSLLANIRDINPRLTLNEAHAALASLNFRNTQTDKPTETLSGGELLRCCMAAVTAAEKLPDLIIMDEPTNNLDVQSLEIVENALNQYRGGLIIISHDETFLNNVGINEEIQM